MPIRRSLIALGLLGLSVTAVAMAPVDSPQSHAISKAPAFDPDKHPGKAVYQQNCAACHEGGMPKAPHREFLETMTPTAILHAMKDGVMQAQSAALDDTQRKQVAEFLTKTDLATYKPAPGPVMCTGKAKEFDLTRPPAQVSWGYDTKRFVPADVAKLKPADVSRLKLKWAYAFPDSLRARSQPVAAMGALFVGSQDGTIHAFDLETGCARWTSKVSAEVRTAIVVESWDAGTRPARNPRLFFGDLLGRVYAMDALTGKVLWRERPDDHANATITGTPTLFEGKLIVPVSSLEVVTAADPNYACCTFRGSVVALNPDTGAMLWKHWTIPDEPKQSRVTSVGTPMFGPSGAPVWGSPAIDPKRKLIYHGSGENYSTPADGNSDAVFAVDALTGARRWVFQLTAGDAWNGTCAMKNHPNCPVENGPDFDLSASPLLVDMGDGTDRVIVGQKSGNVYAVDPDSGKPIWQTRVGRGGIQGGIHFGMAAMGTTLFVGVNDLPMQADGTDATEYGHPGMHAVDLVTGAIKWRTVVPNHCNGKKYCDPGISAAVTAMPGVVFAGHLDGWLRAYDTDSGKVLWEDDTTVPQKTTNGTMTHGGSMSGPGVTIVDGHVITNSGYGFSYHMPGNALLVYTVDGK